jgi:hypothetical protein
LTTYRHKDKANAESGSTGTIVSLDELLALDGEMFIRRAYQTLLLRDADPGGLVNYLGFLESGISKLDIVNELRSSIEGRRHNVALAGAAPVAIDVTDGRVGAVAKDIDQLLALDGQRFVDSAYLTLFHRQADVQGLRHYVPLLRRRGGKAEVLRQLVSSEEYAQHQTPLRGMTSWLAVQPRPRIRILDGLSRLFGSSSSSSAQRSNESSSGGKRTETKALAESDAALPIKPATTYAAPLPANRAARALMTLTPYKERAAHRDHE